MNWSRRRIVKLLFLFESLIFVFGGGLLAAVGLAAETPVEVESADSQYSKWDGSFTSISWSPDGSQLAFLATEGDAEDIFSDDWLFGARGKLSGKPSTVSGQRSAVSGQLCQLWVGHAESGRLKLVDETAGFLSSPAWAPDGHSLTYTRFDPDPPGGGSDQRSAVSGQLQDPGMVRGTLRLLRIYPNAKPAQIVRKSGSFSRQEIQRLPLRRSAWSGDGLYLAAAWPGGLLIEAISGQRSAVSWREEANLAEASLPSWSKDGKFLTIFDRSTPGGIYTIKTKQWSHRQLVFEVPELMQPPIWDRRGGGFFIARKLVDPKLSAAAKPIMQIVRFSMSDRLPHNVLAISLNGDSKGRWTGCYFTYDELRESLFLTVLEDDRPAIIEWVDMETNYRRRAWHPLDDAIVDHPITLGVLSAARGGRWLGFRFGVPEWSAPVGIFDLDRNQVSIWAPNDATLLRTLWSLAEACKRIVRQLPTTAPSPFRMDEPITAFERRRRVEPLQWPLELFQFPLPEADLDSNTSASIDRLTGLGLASIRSAGNRDERSQALQRRLLELEFFFRYIRGDFEAASKSARKLGPMLGPDEPLRRLALETIKIQCHLAMGEDRLARLLLLERIEERTRQLAAKTSVTQPRELQLLGLTDDPETESLQADSDPTAGQDPFLQRFGTLLDEAIRKGELGQEGIVIGDQ